MSLVLIALVLLLLVYCKSFNVLAPGSGLASFPESECKVSALPRHAQVFRRKFFGRLPSRTPQKTTIRCRSAYSRQKKFSVLTRTFWLVSLLLAENEKKITSSRLALLIILVGDCVGFAYLCGNDHGRRRIATMGRHTSIIIYGTIHTPPRTHTIFGA